MKTGNRWHSNVMKENALWKSLAKAKRSAYFSESMEFIVICLLLHSFFLKDVTQTIVKPPIHGLQFFFYSPMLG